MTTQITDPILEREAEKVAKQAAAAERTARFDKSFDSMVRYAGETEVKRGGKLARAIVHCYSGRQVVRSVVLRYTAGTGEFAENTARATYRKDYCRKHSAHYRSVSLALEENGAAKRRDQIEVRNAGFMTKQAAGAIITAALAQTGLMLNAMSGIYSMGTTSPVVDVVFRTKDNLINVNYKDKTGDALTGKELATKRLMPEGIDVRGPAINAANKALNIADICKILTDKISGKLFADFDTDAKNGLTSLMAVLHGMAIPVTDAKDEGDLPISTANKPALPGEVSKVA